MSGTTNVERAPRRYRQRMLVALVVYGVLLVASLVVLDTSAAEDAWWRAPVSLLPMIPALYGVYAVSNRFEEVDELARLILLRALAFAFGGAVVATFSYGLLQASADFPDLNWTWVWAVMGAMWIAGGLLARWQYR